MSPGMGMSPGMIGGRKGIVKASPSNETTTSSSVSFSKAHHLNGIGNCNIKEDVNMPQVLASKLDNVNLDNTSISNDNSCSLYKPEKWMLTDQEQGVLNQLNLAIVSLSLGCLRP